MSVPTRSQKFATTMDKENIAPAFEPENVLPFIQVPTKKMKHQETNHYLDLHNPNEHVKHHDDETDNANNTPNHSMELTSEEINERCKLLKLKIQRMREIAATNDTGNLSTNITDDLNKKKDAKSEAASTPAPSAARVPLQVLSTPTVAAAGSTPFGPPKQSSHIPKPEITSIPPNMRRFGGQLSKPPVRVRFESDDKSSPVTDHQQQPSSAAQPTTPYTRSTTPSAPSVGSPSVDEPQPVPTRNVLSASAEMVLSYEKRSLMVVETTSPTTTGDSQDSTPSARKFKVDLEAMVIPPHKPGRHNTDTLLPAATTTDTLTRPPSPSLEGGKPFDNKTAGAPSSRKQHHLPSSTLEAEEDNNNNNHNKWQRRVSDEGVVSSLPTASMRTKVAQPSSLDASPILAASSPVLPSSPVSPLSSDNEIKENVYASSRQQPHPQQQQHAQPRATTSPSDALEVKPIISLKKSQGEIGVVPSSVSDRKVHFDEVGSGSGSVVESVEEPVVGGGGGRREAASKKGTPRRERREHSQSQMEEKKNQILEWEKERQQQQQQQQQRTSKGSSHSMQQKQQPFKFETVVVNGRPYVQLELLGKGGSSQVYRVLSKNLHIYALKIVALESSVDVVAAEGYMNEISLLKKLNNHDNIIRLIDSEITKGKIYLLLECAETDLDMMIKRQILQNTKGDKTLRSPTLLPSGLGLNHVRLYWEQMLEAVHTIHEERIVHGDLKPANFVCVQGRLKLIDFGIAKAIQNDTTNIVRENQVGTMNYISPEALTDISTDTKQCMKLGRASDIWSLGCILYQMVYGKGPFASVTNLMKKVKAITDSRFVIEYPPLNNPPLLDVMQRCLLRDPRQRPTIPELLHHQFLQ